MIFSCQAHKEEQNLDDTNNFYKPCTENILGLLEISVSCRSKVSVNVQIHFANKI